ncbi:dnaG (nucleomorph) [Hemiselmis andersenii]|uniref:DnaG n=3 Tax=Hemiselmis andersenii TaxID=464988 RepID=A9BL81_HEMAN|nr:dnaG [Hemiselmis andersenii]ABW98264.1 dnaG [Hemiselmis andersenii]
MFFQFLSFSKNFWNVGEEKSSFFHNFKNKNTKICRKNSFLHPYKLKQKRNFINLIISRLSKLIIENGIKLEKKGKYMVAQCPFHFEKSPSFFVNDKKGVYHCFGCGASGNLFSFQKHLKETTIFKNKNNANSEKKLNNEKFFKAYQKNLLDFKSSDNFSLISFQEFFLLQLSSEFFLSLLKKSYKPKTLLQLRNISFGTAKIFQIGYSPPRKKYLFEYLSDLRFPRKKLIKSGIFFFKKKPIEYEKFQKRKSKKLNYYYFDMFQDRFIIPIRNQKGLVIGFGGRLISKTNFPKYLNSSESQLFKKNQSIFSQIMIINSLKNPPKILLLVEGYMDTMALFQNGLRFSAASLGTSFSFFQINKCRNLCSMKHIVVCFDSDNAGKNGIFLLLKKNFFNPIIQNKTSQFSISEIPSNFFSKDPDDFLQKEGCFNFSNIILNNSIPPMVWFENFLFLDSRENIFFLNNIFSQINYIKKKFLPLTKKENQYSQIFEKFLISNQKKKKFLKVLLKKRKDFFLFKERKISYKTIQKKHISPFYNNNDFLTFLNEFIFLSFHFLIFKNDVSCIFFSNNFHPNSYFEWSNKKNFSVSIFLPNQNKKSNDFKRIYLLNLSEKIDKETLNFFLQKFFSLETGTSILFSEKCELFDVTIKGIFFSWLIYQRKTVTKKLKKLIFLYNYLKNRKKIQKSSFSKTSPSQSIIEKNINYEIKIISSIDRCLDTMRTINF